MSDPNASFTSAGTAHLTHARVVVLGLGLMGGSLALALRGKCSALLGVDRDPATLALAWERGVVDAAYDDPAQALKQADLIILALPVRSILLFLDELPQLHPGSAVVLDLGSTKSDITAAMARLPERFDPIGGHPMCGKEKSGLPYAEAAIFQDASFALIPLSRTTAQARGLAAQVVAAVGAHPVWLSPQIHDEWVAATSHIPYLLSCALVASTSLEAAPLIGPGYRSASRLAASPVEMMVDILNTNRVQVLSALSRFKSQLDQLENCLKESQEDHLSNFLTQASLRQGQLLGVRESLSQSELERTGSLPGGS